MRWAASRPNGSRLSGEAAMDWENLNANPLLSSRQLCSCQDVHHRGLPNAGRQLVPSEDSFLPSLRRDGFGARIALPMSRFIRMLLLLMQREESVFSPAPKSQSGYTCRRDHDDGDALVLHVQLSFALWQYCCGCSILHLEQGFTGPLAWPSLVKGSRTRR